MIYNSFSYSVAMIAFLQATTSCYAMEAPDRFLRPSTAARPSKTNQEFAAIFTEAGDLYEAAQKAPRSLKTAASYDQVIKMVEPNLEALERHAMIALALEGASGEGLCTQMLISSLENRGEILYKIANGSTPLSMQKKIELLTNASQCFRKNYMLQKTNASQAESTRTASSNFANCLHSLGLVYALHAEQEKDPAQKITTYLKALKSHKDSYTLDSVGSKTEECRMGLMLALKEASSVYFDIENKLIAQQKDVLESYQTTVKNLEILKNILNIFENYLMNSFVKFDWKIEMPTPSKTNQKRQQKTITPQQKTSILHPDDCITRIYGTYCGSLYRASQSVVKIPVQNEMLAAVYQQKGEEHLDLAVKTYKTKLYQNEYDHDADKEKDFILARLAAHAGNDEPIKEFYRTLRQEYQARQRQRIVHQIKEQQEAQRLQEALERQTDEERAKQQQRARQNRQQLETTNNSATITTSTDDNTLKNNSTAVMTTTTTTTTPQSFDHQPQQKQSPTIKKAQTESKSQKTSGPKLVTETTTETIVARAQRTIILAPDMYKVFQGLTGEIYHRHITLKQVISMLGNMGGRFSVAGGSHNKYTAFNGATWTTPPSWDGPIPTRYRLQLMHFLLEDLGVDTGELEVKLKGQ